MKVLLVGVVIALDCASVRGGPNGLSPAGGPAGVHEGASVD